MKEHNKSEAMKQLSVLQQTFKEKLPEKITEIELLWKHFTQDSSNASYLKNFHRSVHNLSGSGGTFGAIAVSTTASEVEQIVKLFINEPALLIGSETQQIDTLLAELKQLANNWQPSDIPYIPPDDEKDLNKSNLIYLTEDDDLLAQEIMTKLEQAGYKAKHFTELDHFEDACKKEMPAVFIMDIIFKEGDVAGAEAITRLQNKLEYCPPVIFISMRDDMEARLAAARAGARRYFCKPLDMNKLIQTLDGMTARLAIKPYRVLLIDDDETLLEYYATVLRNAGMEVKALSQPLDGLQALNEFMPDIVVLDIYMSECSGPELAQVIRQDDTWVMMPIMFLSTESDLNRQLAAMNLGGDDFLVKPVDAGHLVAAVIARAKRARWSSRLNKDLQNALRESKFLTTTMDQHDIVSSADVTGRIISVNDRLCEISGYSREELLGNNHRILQSGIHSSAFYKELWHTIDQGKIWRGTFCNRKKNGKEYWVEASIVPFLDDKGKPYKYVSAQTDITTLRESEERLHRSQTFAKIGTWDWNITNGDLYWSNNIAPLFGYQDEIPETSYENFIAAVHPDDRKMVTDSVNNCVVRGAEYNIEHRVIWSDGSVHWVHESGDIVRSEDGKPLHM
ncbi:MAG: PAS domain-containing protein, partial [Gammaproteobacteria bacterium]|nr:PAS domain-containing protein [Gammaproteobacteria bacterium]